MEPLTAAVRRGPLLVAALVSYTTWPAAIVPEEPGQPTGGTQSADTLSRPWHHFISVLSAGSHGQVSSDTLLS